MGERECLGCGQTIRVDPRFSAWCPHCLWNVDPVPGAPEPQGRQAHRRERERRLATEVHDRVLGNVAPVSPRRRAGVLVAAAAVNLTTLLLVVALIRLLVLDLPVVVRLVLVPLLALLLVGVWPRPVRLDPEVRTMTPDEAPAAAELVGQVAAALGVLAPHMVAVDTEYRASLELVGWRRRPVLVVGWALWNVLDPQAKVALVAHELGHLAMGDVRRSMPVWFAGQTLRRWARVFEVGPGSWERSMAKVRFAPGAGDYAFVIRGGATGSASFAALLEQVAGLLMRPVAYGLTVLGRAFESATTRAGEPAEYLADQAAARVAGTQAAIAVLRASALAGPAERAVTTAVNRGERDIWAAERLVLEQLPASEVDRAMIAAAQRWDRVDAAHPPTHLRLDVLARRPGTAALMTPAAGTIAAMDGELGVRVRRDRVAVTLAGTPTWG